MTKRINTLREQILATYNDLTNRPGGAITLTDLRAHLAAVSRKDLDRVLIEMDDNREIQLEPDPDRRGLTPQDHAAAITLCGRALHLLRVVVR